MSKPEEFKFDTRVRDRFLRSRVLSSGDIAKHLEELPDLEGQYEVLSEMPQPAVAPPRSEAPEEPLMFDGIRRLQALGEASGAQAPQSSAAAPRSAPPAPSPAPSHREPEARPLGTPLRSALMESEISGVGAGAVSAALGAMAAEARGASVFGVPTSVPTPPIEEPPPPVTLRSEPSEPSVAWPPAVPAPAVPAPAVPAVEAPAEVSGELAPESAEAAAHGGVESEDDVEVESEDLVAEDESDDDVVAEAAGEDHAVAEAAGEGDAVAEAAGEDDAVGADEDDAEAAGEDDEPQEQA